VGCGEVTGRTLTSAQQPARHAHIDLTLEGLRDTLRLARQDITAMAQPIIDAEDARARGEDVEVQGYAAYSMWVSILLDGHQQEWSWIDLLFSAH
jgi:GA4 desaturase